jgi:hypothetical protein
VLVDPTNNLPTSQAYCYDLTDTPVWALQTIMTEVSNANLNLTEPEKELLRWHHCLGLFGYRKIQQLMKSCVLSHSQATCSLHTAASKILNPPKCATCQYGKQCCRLSPGKTSSVVQDQVSRCLEARRLICQTENCSQSLCLQHQRPSLYIKRKDK